MRQERVSPAQGLVDPPSYPASLIAREREHATRCRGDGKAVLDEQPDGHQDLAERRWLERNEVARRNRAGLTIEADRLLDRNRTVPVTGFPQASAIPLERPTKTLAERPDHGEPGAVLALIQPLPTVLS